MASIKVTYGQTSRKYTIASNTTWTEFESQLHDLFDIPNDTVISVSYVDEDGDIITLSTDSELQQILSEQESFGANVKFNVYTSEHPDNNNNGWVLEDAEGKEESIATISDDETFSNKDEEVVAYNISEPSETDIKQVSNEEQQPAVEINYPHVTVTDVDDDPLFKSSIPVDSVNEEKGQNQETFTEPLNETEKSSSTFTEPLNETERSSSTSTDPLNETERSSTSPNENNEESENENDSNFIFIISSSPWIQRSYYRPRLGLFGGLLSGYPTHFGHFARPRYSYITPNYGFRRNPYFRTRGIRYNNGFGFGGGLYNGLCSF